MYLGFVFRVQLRYLGFGFVQNPINWGKTQIIGYSYFGSLVSRLRLDEKQRNVQRFEVSEALRLDRRLQVIRLNFFVESFSLKILSQVTKKSSQLHSNGINE